MEESGPESSESVEAIITESVIAESDSEAELPDVASEPGIGDSVGAREEIEDIDVEVIEQLDVENKTRWVVEQHTNGGSGKLQRNDQKTV